MFGIRLQFSWTTVLLLAAAGLGTLEVYATSARGVHFHSREPQIVAASAGRSDTDEHQSIVAGVVSSAISTDAILVVGNPNLATNTDLEVTIRAIPVSRSRGEPRLSPANQVACQTAAMIVAPVGRSQRPPAPSSKGAVQHERIYFLPSKIQSVGSDGHHTAVPCRLVLENRRILIYVDQRLSFDDSMRDLVAEIDSVSTSTMIETVERFAGSTADVDGDGHLTIVITPDAGRLGTSETPVYGITQPSDFVAGVERPRGNNSDVIFLNSSIPLGSTLSTVLCHEWCHASVFSRHHGLVGSSCVDDDWLNEAIAHVIEVAASGSDVNIAHRIRGYRAQPASSPLVIQDYCCPEYWRHNGVRGAGYLFLDWYLKQADGESLSRLLSEPSLDVASLEAASKRPFTELFRAWTVSQGEQLAKENRDQRSDDSTSSRLAHHRWVLRGTEEQMLALKVGATCADFVSIECPEGSDWQIIAIKPVTDHVQVTLLPTYPCQR